MIQLKIERHWKLMYLLRGYKQGELGRNHFQTCPNGTSEKSIRDKIAKELKICQWRWN